MLTPESKENVRRTIESMIGKFPFSRLFFENPTLSSGFNLRDYRDVIELFRFDSELLPGKYVVIGNVTYYNSQQLVDAYRQTRRLLIGTFEDEKFQEGLRLEDVLLIDGIIRYDLTRGTMKIGEPIEGYADWNSKHVGRIKGSQYSTQSIVALLRDIVTLACTTPADNKTKDFLVKITMPYPDSSPIILTSDFYEFAKENSTDAQVRETYNRFRRRIADQLRLEIDVRFGGVMEEGRDSQWKGDEELDAKVLRKMGIDEQLIYLGGSADKNLHILQDTLKNSIWSMPTVVAKRDLQ